MYTFDFGSLQSYWHPLLHGFARTLEISLLSCGMCALVVAIAYLVRIVVNRRFKPIVSGLLRVYIDIVQAIPVLVGLVWVYFGLALGGVRLSPEVSAVLVLGISFSAFALDLFFGAEQAISREKIHVAELHNVNRVTIVTRLYVPTIVRMTADPLVGQIVSLLKLSTFASVLGAQEVLSIANGIISVTYRPLEVYGLVAFMFLLFIVPLNLIRRAVQHGTIHRSELS